MELYILNADNVGVPVSWGDYELWHDNLPADQKCNLGKRLKQDTVGDITIATMFLGTPMGFFGRKPQLWVSISLGPNEYAEQVYSSHRACLQGHSRTIRQIKKGE